MSANQPIVILAGQGRTLHALGDAITIQLEASHTGGNFTSLMVVTPPGGGPPPHFHDREDEWFFVIEGRVSFLANDIWTEIAAGGTVFAPRKSIHTFKNVGQTPSKLLVHASPAGIESFFTALASECAKPGGPDMGQVIRIATQHGIHILAP